MFTGPRAARLKPCPFKYAPFQIGCALSNRACALKSDMRFQIGRALSNRTYPFKSGVPFQIRALFKSDRALSNRICETSSSYAIRANVLNCVVLSCPGPQRKKHCNGVPPFKKHQEKQLLMPFPPMRSCGMTPKAAWPLEAPPTWVALLFWRSTMSAENPGSRIFTSFLLCLSLQSTSSLRKKSEMHTPRGLKSARRVEIKGLDADLKVSSTEILFTRLRLTLFHRS